MKARGCNKHTSTCVLVREQKFKEQEWIFDSQEILSLKMLRMYSKVFYIIYTPCGVKLQV